MRKTQCPVMFVSTLLVIHNGQGCECALCDFVSVDKTSVTRHIRKRYSASLKTKDGELEKSVKSEFKEKLAEMTLKVSDESGSDMWKCRECGKESKGKDKLEAHIETHLDGFKHVCTICNQNYKTRISLQGHKFKVHTEKKVKTELKAVSISEDVNNLGQIDIDLKTESTSDDLNALGLVEIELKTESTSYVSGLVEICRKAYNEQEDRLRTEISKKMTKT